MFRVAEVIVGCVCAGGAAFGANNAAASGYDIQARYNIAYAQRMYAHGDTVQNLPNNGYGYYGYTSVDYPYYGYPCGYPSYGYPYYGYPCGYPYYGNPYGWAGPGFFGGGIFLFGRNFHHGFHVRFHDGFHRGFNHGFHGVGGFHR